MEDFERFVLFSDHPKALECCWQLGEYLAKLRRGTHTEADYEALQSKLRKVYDELNGQVPQGV